LKTVLKRVLILENYRDTSPAVWIFSGLDPLPWGYPQGRSVGSGMRFATASGVVAVHMRRAEVLASV
jgi:hypothetical protein